MSDNWTWQPVENKTDIRCSCESTDCSKALIVAYDEIQIYDVHMGGGFSFLLPPDLRLCRRVPAQGVPVDAIKMLLFALEVWHEYNSDGDVPSHIELRDMAIVRAWLDAQPQGQEGE